MPQKCIWTRYLTVIAAAPLLLSWGCAKSAATAPTKGSSPAHVESHPDEAHVFRVTLTEQAVQRLGIQTAEIARQPMPRRRTYGGEIVIPPGHLIAVTAPAAGTLANPAQGPAPTPGAQVTANQPIFSLTPFLTPERYFPTPAERVQMANAQATLVSSQIAARGAMERAEAEVEGAEIALNRAEELLKQKVGSARDVDTARATYNVATAGLEAAQETVTTLDRLSLDGSSGEMQQIEVVAPDAGILHDVSATRGQTVTIGAQLFQVADLSTVWARVPVYVGQVEEIEPSANATILPLGTNGSTDSIPAKPVAAPPTADVLSSSAHVYYEIDNANAILRPGQRVGISVPLRGEQESLVIPSSAVVYDIHGTAWVYAEVEPAAYERRRVQVRFTTGDAGTDELAVLQSGPLPGTKVVVAGAAELFGTEFGAGH